ncbi:pLS20_p028 family conjugation system transmembrane protein [Eubacterium multiforme]|uniref:DUF8208 domain-containing protein n=1 Tax=Eubacterium multiforme TaxID=83339 RepID=A0ABT9UTF7_9FIRM|nr:hypothetical protein [Eubacterium multiforme]MDQ0149623.1 hypothetical protein [Eubacterium multiforme]
MTDIEFIKMLIENHVLSPMGVFADGLRKIGWWIISGLVSLVDGLEKVATKVYSFNDFFDSKGVNDLLNAYKPLIFGILVLALLFLGYSIMLQKKKDRSEIPTNILISAMVIIALPLFMTKLGDLTQMFVSYNISEQQSSAKGIVKDNVSDLYYLDRADFKIGNKKNDIPVKDIMNIDINEQLDASKINNKDFKDVFKQKLSRDEKGNEKLVDLDKGFFGMFEEGYYRYNANFLIIIFSLAITGITLLCIALKVAGIIFELGFKKIFATLLAMADISDGRKLKAIIMDIVSSFAVLMVTSVLLKMYVVFVAFLGNKLESYSILNLVVLAGVSWKVIDAPDIVERILGIDAGVKSNWASVLAGYEGVKGAGRALMGAGRLAKKGFANGKNAFRSLSDKGKDSSNNGGIYGNENSENNSNTNNTTSQNSNNSTSNNKNNGTNMNNNSSTNKSNNKSENTSRNNGIYNKAGDNVSNNQNINNNNNNGNNNNTGKGVYDNSNNNINTNKGTPIHDNSKSPNTANLKKDFNNKANESSNQGNKASNSNINNNVTSKSTPGNSNINSRNNFNIKGSNSPNINNVKNKNYNIGNQNKWNIKGKGNKNNAI